MSQVIDALPRRGHSAAQRGSARTIHRAVEGDCRRSTDFTVKASSESMIAICVPTSHQNVPAATGSGQTPANLRNAMPSIVTIQQHPDRVHRSFLYQAFAQYVFAYAQHPSVRSRRRR